MSAALAPAVSAGGLRAAAIVRTTRGAGLVAGRLAGHGARRPLALLVETAAGRAAFTPAGRPLGEAEVEALCPGAWAAFAAG